MNSFIQQVFSILNTSPGNIAYHIILAFSAAGAMQASMLYWRGTGSLAGGRAALGSALLLIVRLFMFAVGALALAGYVLPAAIPPLDRAAALFGLLLIVWLWSFPARSKLADTAVVLLSLLVIVYSALTIAWWSTLAGTQTYNSTWLDRSGQVFALLIILYGLLNLLIRRPEGWGMGFASLLILAAGHVVHLLFPLPNSDFQGAVRLAELAAYPMLLALPHRFTYLPPLRPETSPAVSKSSGELLAEPAAWGPFLGLASAGEPAQVYKVAAQAFGLALPAEVCLVFAPQDNRNRITILSGYNQKTSQEIQPMQFEGGLAGTISNGLYHSRAIRLSAANTISTTPQELTQALGFSHLGGLMIVPFQPDTEPVALGLAVLSPYSDRSWTTEDQDTLAQFAIILCRLINQAAGAEKHAAEIEQVRKKLKDTQAHVENARMQNEDLLGQLEAARQQLGSERSRAESMASRLISRDESQEVISRLEAEIQSLRTQSFAEPAAANPQAEEHLRQAEMEISNLKRDLFTAETTVKQFQNKEQAAQPADEHSEIIAAISQELRQPMSSISGYTDLLLGESAGILGALQRKFLERIKASTERMGSLLDDLIQISVNADGRAQLAPTTVDMNSVIDDAIAMCMAPLREKNIALRVDIPEALPPIVADRDGMTQILIHLLANAGAASDVEGEITLHAAVKHEESATDYILVQVTDSGGGIPTQDLPRVFSRLYRADNPLIQGLGDTGVGLSIVKTLVEAHNGRIWVDSIVGKGSTFSILLPVGNDDNLTFPKVKGAG